MAAPPTINIGAILAAIAARNTAPQGTPPAQAPPDMNGQPQPGLFASLLANIRSSGNTAGTASPLGPMGAGAPPMAFPQPPNAFGVNGPTGTSNTPPVGVQPPPPAPNQLMTGTPIIQAGPSQYVPDASGPQHPFSAGPPSGWTGPIVQPPAAPPVAAPAPAPGEQPGSTSPLMAALQKGISGRLNTDESQMNGSGDSAPKAPAYINDPARPVPSAPPDTRQTLPGIGGLILAAALGGVAGGGRGALGAEQGVVGAQNADNQAKVAAWQQQNANADKLYTDTVAGNKNQNDFNAKQFGTQASVYDTGVKVKSETDAKAATVAQQKANDDNLKQGRQDSVISGYFKTDPIAAVSAAQTYADSETDPATKAHYQQQVDWIKQGVASGEYPNLLLTKNNQIVAKTAETNAETGLIKGRTNDLDNKQFATALQQAGTASTPAQKNAIIGAYNSANAAAIKAGTMNYMPKEGETYNGTVMHYTPDLVKQSTMNYQAQQVAASKANQAGTSYLDTLAKQRADDDSARTKYEIGKPYSTAPGTPGSVDYKTVVSARDKASADLDGASEELRVWRALPSSKGQPDDPTLSEKVNGLEGVVRSYDSQIQGMTPPAPKGASGASNTSLRTDPISPQVNRYRPAIQAAARRYGVSPDVLASVMQQESGGDGTEVSSTGARGIMQFEPGTAKQYGVNVNDPKSSINGAAHYLSDLTNQYGSIEAALQHYSGGKPNYATEVMNRAGNPRNRGGSQVASKAPDISKFMLK